MITLLFLTAVALTVVRSSGVRTRYLWWSPYLALIILVLYALERSASGVPLLLSDEIAYATEDIADFRFLEYKDRWGWLALNKIVIDYDMAPLFLPLKLISVTFLPLLCLGLIRLWPSNTLVGLAPIALPYIALTATLNLRDTGLLMLIVLGSASALDGRRRGAASLRWIAVFGLAVFLLRPLVGLLSLAVWTMFLQWPLKGRRNRRIRFYLRLLPALGLLIVLLASVPWVDTIVTRSWNLVLIRAEAASVEAEAGIPLEDREVRVPSNVKDVGVAVLRYVVTPLPTSLARRIRQGGSSWGIVDDSVRLIHQLSVLFMAAMLLLNFKWVWQAVTSLTRGQAALLMILASHLPLYVAYSGGGSHQRNKLPFQLAIFLIFATVHQLKRHRRLTLHKTMVSGLASQVGYRGRF